MRRSDTAASSYPRVQWLDPSQELDTIPGEVFACSPSTRVLYEAFLDHQLHDGVMRTGSSKDAAVHRIHQRVTQAVKALGLSASHPLWEEAEGATLRERGLGAFVVLVSGLMKGQLEEDGLKACDLPPDHTAWLREARTWLAGQGLSKGAANAGVCWTHPASGWLRVPNPLAIAYRRLDAPDAVEVFDVHRFSMPTDAEGTFHHCVAFGTPWYSLNPRPGRHENALDRLGMVCAETWVDVVLDVGSSEKFQQKVAEARKPRGLPESGGATDPQPYPKDYLNWKVGEGQRVCFIKTIVPAQEGNQLTMRFSNTFGSMVKETTLLNHPFWSRDRLNLLEQLRDPSCADPTTLLQARRREERKVAKYYTTPRLGVSAERADVVHAVFAKRHAAQQWKSSSPTSVSLSVAGLLEETLSSWETVQDAMGARVDLSDVWPSIWTHKVACHPQYEHLTNTALMVGLWQIQTLHEVATEHVDDEVSSTPPWASDHADALLGVVINVALQEVELDWAKKRLPSAGDGDKETDALTRSPRDLAGLKGLEEALVQTCAERWTSLRKSVARNHGVEVSDLEGAEQQIRDHVRQVFRSQLLEEVASELGNVTSEPLALVRPPQAPKPANTVPKATARHGWRKAVERSAWLVGSVMLLGGMALFLRFKTLIPWELTATTFGLAGGCLMLVVLLYLVRPSQPIPSSVMAEQGSRVRADVVAQLAMPPSSPPKPDEKSVVAKTSHHTVASVGS